MPEPLFLETAVRLARRLCRDALWSGAGCNWLGWAVDVFGRNWTVVYKAQSASLYDGTAGIALFLARLHRVAPEPLFAATAIGAINHAIAALPDMPPEIRHGVYSGSLGVAWAAVEIGRALDDARVGRRGLRDAAQFGRAPESQAWLDIIGGSAGSIQALLALGLPDLALPHGDLLLRAAVKSDAGWSWDTMPGQSKQNVCGYGHGAGGIGCALLELWSATGEKRFLHAAQEAFRYERSHFNAPQGNWPDLRDMTGYGAPTDQPVFAMGWCHGAPGIGLSRLRAHQILPGDPAIAAELEAALATTAGACRQWIPAPGSGLSLCHGLGGNADLLLAAADWFARPALRQIAADAAAAAIQQIVPNDMPWPCGVNGGGESPNLMLGLAGIGHFLLRLHDPAGVPSVLLCGPEVAAPVRAAGAATYLVGCVPG
jgi:lantibiotic modifying enzyme